MFKFIKGVVLWRLHRELALAREQLSLYHRRENAMIASRDTNARLLNIVKAQIVKLELKIVAIEAEIESLK